MKAKVSAHMDDAVRLYQEGFSFQEIAERFGVTSSAVNKAFRRRGIPSRSRSKLAEHRQEAVRLYREGLSHRELANRFDVSHSTLSRTFIRWGVSSRSGSESRIVALRRGTVQPPRGADHWYWRGGRKLSSYGYLLVLLPEHHLANGNGYVYEHRLVAEQTLGRQLGPGEVVHHINGDVADNDPANLAVMSKGQHTALHKQQEKATRT